MFDLLQETLKKFHYDLPKELIANQPVEPRDQSRLLFLNRQTGERQDRHFYELVDLLNSGDVLVLNESKVFPARLLGKKQSGGKVELLLIKQVATNRWQAIAKPGLKIGQRLFFPERAMNFEDLDLEDLLQAKVVARAAASAEVEVEFNRSADQLWQAIDRCGLTPLPPYIFNQQDEEKRRAEYQTVYAKNTGSAAAPTAGLHFTAELLEKLQKRGVQIEKVNLHVGLGTFAKLKSENLVNKNLHEEYYEIEPAVAERILHAKQAGQRIVAVGTTTARTLESAWQNSAGEKSVSFSLKTGPQKTSIFIDPPYRFQLVDVLITNFHLPESSLLMMLAAFCSQPNTAEKFEQFIDSSIGQAYQHAIDQRYRFFSFGDAMLIV